MYDEYDPIIKLDFVKEESSSLIAVNRSKTRSTKRSNFAVAPMIALPLGVSVKYIGEGSTPKGE